MSKVVINIAVVGCGWWAQGWHLPHLQANAPHVKIVAVVDPARKPISTLSSSPLLSLRDLADKYSCRYFTSVSDLLADPIGCTIDGFVVATSHASHFEVGMALLHEGIRRRQTSEVHKPLNILMEKPMTTNVDEARKLYEMSFNKYPEGAFIINHTASYRPQTMIAREIIASNQIGKIRHISASMNGPLMWLFDDESNHSWVSKTPWRPSDGEDDSSDQRPPMDGNGYAWGQIAHVLAWIYAVLGTHDAIPTKVYCTMAHSMNTDADISLAAVISCEDGVTFSLNGTALLPGSQYADPAIGKLINIEIFGEKGALMYGGDDKKPDSGRLELRKTAIGTKEDGQSEYPCSNQEWCEKIGHAVPGLKDGFYFEDGEQEGVGPGSMQAFLDACRADHDGKRSLKSTVNDSLIGYRTVQIISALYRSSLSGNAEAV